MVKQTHPIRKFMMSVKFHGNFPEGKTGLVSRKLPVKSRETGQNRPATYPENIDKKYGGGGKMILVYFCIYKQI